MAARMLLVSLGGFLVSLGLVLADERIDRLIQQLGSADFAEREAATRDLEAVGGPALPALKQAAQGNDIETRRRAEEVIARIEKKLESVRLLAPTKVAFDYQNQPLADAVADLARRSGLPIVLSDAARLKDRTVTARVDNLDFWPALDRFCQAAGLTEAVSVPVPLNNPAQPFAVRRPTGISEQIVLVDGASPPLPTAYHGAARVRALPAEVGFARDQVGCTLGLALEAPLQISKIVAVRIDRADDEQGRPVEFLPGDPKAGNPVFIGNLGGQVQGILPTSGQHQTPLRFKADKPQQLRELAGTVAVEMRTRPDVLMTVDNVMKAMGQSVKGKAGGALTIQDIEKQDDGAWRLRVELQPPAENNPNNAGAVQIQIQQIQIMQIGAGGRIQPIGLQNDRGLALLDGNGERFELIGIPSVRHRIDPTGVTQEYVLLFRPRAGQADPARLTYSSTRQAIVEVPFTLKDVGVR